MKSDIFVLGVSAFFHDSAACLIKNGEIVAAAQEERFTRKKNSADFPYNAINYCLEEAEISMSQLSSIAFYDNPVATFDRIMQTFIEVGERGIAQYLKVIPTWLSKKIFITKTFHKNLNCNVPVLFSEHHFSHAASAFYPSPFKEAAILTFDGVGEWATTSLGVGSESGIKIFKEIHFPHSLGLLYSAFTQYCGFKVNSGEYKLMGLAPYGTPKYVDTITSQLISIKDDGSFSLNMEYFGFLDSQSTINEAFEKLFGGKSRLPESMITQREMDLAASIQKVTEEVTLKLVKHLKEITGMKNLVLAGGVALNCVSNGKLLKEKVFDHLWIQPASNDAGGALGAALIVSHEYFKVHRKLPSNGGDSQKGSYLGPQYSNDEIRSFLDYNNLPYREVDDEERAKVVAEAIYKGKVVGYFVGRMEFGPRSLGARSILGDARDPNAKKNINLKIKFRESFRPFAPSVLEERCREFFDLECESPYMLLVAQVKEERKVAAEEIVSENLIEIINQKRSNVPAITHVDCSARVHTVNRDVKKDFYEVIREFEKLSGEAIVVNTSFNVRGEPIVCNYKDAYKCFMRTDIDVLVLENSILLKKEQPLFVEKSNWRDEYGLD